MLTNQANYRPFDGCWLLFPGLMTVGITIARKRVLLVRIITRMADESERRLQVFTHPLSVFCRRVTYALSFKSIAYETIETDLLHPTDDFLSVSWQKEVPAMRVVQGSKTFALVESLNIVEYLDATYPGPPLYVRGMDGRVDSLKKALLDTEIVKRVEPLLKLYIPFIPGTATTDNVTQLRKVLTILNEDLLADGRHFAHRILEVDVVTAGDIALLPMIEFLRVFQDRLFAAVRVQDFANIWTWYDRISTQPWCTRNYPGDRPIENYFHLATTGVYPKLTLPLSLYA